MSAALRFLHVLSRIHPKAAPNSCSMRETILNPERRPGDQEPCVFPRSRLTFALKAGSKFRKHLRISPTEGPTELKNNTRKVLPKSWAKRLLPFVGGNKNALRGPEPTRWLPPAITRPLLHANTNRESRYGTTRKCVHASKSMPLVPFRHSYQGSPLNIAREYCGLTRRPSTPCVAACAGGLRHGVHERREGHVHSGGLQV